MYGTGYPGAITTVEGAVMSSEKSDDPMADAKAKMRAALDRKAEREHLTEEAPPNTGPVHGSEIDNVGRREFRRKSG